MDMLVHDILDNCTTEQLRKIMYQCECIIGSRGAAKSTKILDQDISVRLLNCLYNAEITDLRQLRNVHHSQVRKWPRFGRKSFIELINLLESHDIYLKMR